MANRGLIRVEAASIEEITAHFPNFAEFLIGVTVESLEAAGIDEGVIVIVHVIFLVGIGMKRCTEREALEYWLD